MGKAKLKSIEKATSRRGNGKSTPPLKSTKSLGVNKMGGINKNGKASVVVGKKN